MPALVRSSTTRPTPEKVRENDFWASMLIPPTRAAVRIWAQQLTTEGKDHVPLDQPSLILSNHSSLLDPLSILFTMPRYAQFMATQSLFESVLGRILAWWGVVPKKKFTADTRSIRLLKGWTNAGSPVALFPEGQRTWDGRPIPLLEGVEKLVRLLDVPVVTARIYNGDRVWPRWAPRPRRGRVHVIYDPPLVFERRSDPKLIRETITQRIQVEPDIHRYPVRGKDLAIGLANLLFACPTCGVVEALVELGNQISCVHCESRWRVDTQNMLSSVDGGSKLSISQAWDIVRKRLAQQNWVTDPVRFDQDGVIMESGELSLFDVSEDAPELIGTGRIKLTSEGLQLDGNSPWSLPFRELRSVSAEQRDRLYFVTKNRCYEPVMPQESVVKWEFVTDHWLRQARQELGP